MLNEEGRKRGSAFKVKVKIQDREQENKVAKQTNKINNK
jgi:hypothetical protein